MLLDVVIVSVDRSSVWQVIESLFASAGHLLQRVILVGRVEIAVIDRLQARHGVDAVEYHLDDSEGFCKSRLLNLGLTASRAECVLVSDADILWQPCALAEMTDAVAAGGVFCHAAQVLETDASTQASSGVRYSPRVRQSAGAAHVAIEPEPASGQTVQQRPGPGLVMARRADWLAVGGYNEQLIGWGWEDQDLLTRAQILGFSVCGRGTVHHMSHPDSMRNALTGGKPKQLTRNQNIAASARMLRAGIIRGPLFAGPRQGTPVETIIPQELQA